MAKSIIVSAIFTILNLYKWLMIFFFNVWDFLKTKRIHGMRRFVSQAYLISGFFILNLSIFRQPNYGNLWIECDFLSSNFVMLIDHQIFLWFTDRVAGRFFWRPDWFVSYLRNYCCSLPAHHSFRRVDFPVYIKVNPQRVFEEPGKINAGSPNNPD